MSKAGIIEEMMNDSLDSAMDSEDMEEQTEEQVGWAGLGWAGLGLRALLAWKWQGKWGREGGGWAALAAGQLGQGGS